MKYSQQSDLITGLDHTTKFLRIIVNINKIINVFSKISIDKYGLKLENMCKIELENFTALKIICIINKLRVLIKIIKHHISRANEILLNSVY